MRELTDCEIELIIQALNLLWVKQSKNGKAPTSRSDATAELLNAFAAELDERENWTIIMAQAKQYEDGFAAEQKKMSFQEVMKRVASRHSMDGVNSLSEHADC